MRGQSETLGFVFVFTLILLSVGLVTGLGVAELEDLRQEERTHNVERAFDVFESNVEDVTRRGAPSRATEMKLAGGTLRFGNATTLNVSVRNTTDPGDNRTFKTQATPLVFADGEGTDIVYEHGAVVRSDRGNAVLLDSPEWIADADRVLIPLVATQEGGTREAVSGGTALIVARRTGGGLHGAFVPGSDATEADANVTVTVTSPRAAVWKRYLEDLGFTEADDDPSDDDVTYWRHTDAVIVPRTTIQVELGR